MVQRLALLIQQKEVQGVIPGQPDPPRMEVACSPRVRMGFLQVLQFSLTLKDLHVRYGTLLPLASRTGVGPWVLHCGCLCN